MIIRFPESNIRTFLIIWGLFLAGILALAGIFLINRMAGSDKLIQAQVRVYDAQTANVGKPTIIEQNYHTIQK
jgi:hypothetical protein